MCCGKRHKANAMHCAWLKARALRHKENMQYNVRHVHRHGLVPGGGAFLT